MLGAQDFMVRNLWAPCYFLHDSLADYTVYMCYVYVCTVLSRFFLILLNVRCTPAQWKPFMFTSWQHKDKDNAKNSAYLKFNMCFITSISTCISWFKNSIFHSSETWPCWSSRTPPFWQRVEENQGEVQCKTRFISAMCHMQRRLWSTTTGNNL